MITHDYQSFKTPTHNARNKRVERVFRDRMLNHTGYHFNPNADGFPKTHQRDYRKKNRGRVDTHFRECLRGSWLCRERRRGRHFMPRKSANRVCEPDRLVNRVV
mgnify:CR=1 FL=1